jgi:exodeoxyribonuclease VII small subunit
MEGLLSRYYMRRVLLPDGFAEGLDMVKKKGEEPETVDFEGSLQELETIVRRLEQGGGPLEQALGDYAQAIILLKSCHGRLEQAERKIEILSGVDANGTPVVRQVDDEELSLEDKQESRGQRRAVPRGQSPNSSGPRAKHSPNNDDEGSLF